MFRRSKLVRPSWPPRDRIDLTKVAKEPKGEAKISQFKDFKKDSSKDLRSFFFHHFFQCESQGQESQPNPRYKYLWKSYDLFQNGNPRSATSLTHLCSLSMITFAEHSCGICKSNNSGSLKWSIAEGKKTNPSQSKK